MKQFQEEGMEKLVNKGFYEKTTVLPNAYWKNLLSLIYAVIFLSNYFDVCFKIKPTAIFFSFVFSLKIDVFSV